MTCSNPDPGTRNRTRTKILNTFRDGRVYSSCLWVNGRATESSSLFTARLLPGRHDYRGANGVSYRFEVSAVGLLVDLENLLGRGLATGFGTGSLNILRT